MKSKSVSVNVTANGLAANQAQQAAGHAKSAAETAQELAYSAQRAADGKNSIYRGSDYSTVPTANLKVGDLYFSDNAAYVWNGSSWAEAVSDTTGAEIHEKVDKAMAEKDKAIADMKADIQADVAKINEEIEQTNIKTGNALNFYKEQYYLSTSYTELKGGSWSDTVPTKTPGKYVWSRYVTANVGDPTNQQYSDPVCISGLDGKDGATGPQGPQGVAGPKGADGRTTYVHVAYADSADGKSNFSVNYFADALYIGVLTDYTQADSTDYTQYTWSRLKGDAGDQGIPGPKGEDGRTTYVHFAYANSSDGTIGFDVSNSVGKLYIGQYTDYTQADSTDPASYAWTKIKGETGPTGATGPKGDTGDTGFFIGTTPPPNPSKGTVWAINDSSGNMTSAKTWNGSDWVSTAFTQDLVAGNISATKIVGGELDVNKITVKNAQNIPITSTVSLGQKLSDIEQDADSINAYVKGSKGSDTLKAILSMDPNHSSIAQVVNGQIAAAISTHSDGSVRIDGKALYINSHAKIDDATIKSSMIDSLEASKIKAGVLDASQITVINLDAHSITTRSLSAVVNDLRKFETFVVSPSNAWDFNYTKSSYGNWFLIGETTADHVYNGPSYPGGQKLTPYMYVTSRGPENGDRYTVTVWKDNDPTQYQRVWSNNGWSDWVMLPNSQNIVSAINLSPDSVKISGKNIELDGNTTVTGQLDLMPKNTNYVNQNSNYHNPWSWNNAHIYLNNYLQLLGENCDVTYEDSSHLNGEKKFYSIGTLTPGYLKFTAYQNKVSTAEDKFDGQFARTYIDSSRIETNDAWLGNLRIVGHHIRAADDKFVLISNHAGTNFDNNGSVGLQVYGGIGLGRSKIYTPDLDLYIQRGNAVTALGQSYNDAGKVDVHCNRVISQRANTVSSRLSVKTDITPVSYDRALAAVEGTEIYDYRYINDESGQHYVSGIIDDVNPEDPQYHMDDMLINKERTARIDANLVGYHHVILQELLKKIDELEIKVKSLETRLESKEK
ncbi:hypothetical protein [Lactobacillus delbrueckii]|uniref:hypothetical protein n=1 Tax=Lactobacillus delbrueckii TaxID=1584 RepID=UPI0035CF9552